jgi:hypothetical protein
MMIAKSSLGSAVVARQRLNGFGTTRSVICFVLLGIMALLFVRSNFLNTNNVLSPSSLLYDTVALSSSQNTEQDEAPQLHERFTKTEAERDALARQVQDLQQQIQQQQLQIIPSGTDDKNDSAQAEGAFPYRLTCPGDALPGRPGHDYNIALAYHVGMIKNWKTIVRDQMNTLKECGLGAAASDFILSHSGGTLEMIQDLVRPYNFFVAANASIMDNHQIPKDAQQQRRTIVVNSTKVPWEGPIMNQILEYCIAQEATNPSKPTIVFYFHNKGASKYKTVQYQKTLYWRKFMEYFLHERPSLCLNELLYKGAGTCGIMWHGTHFSGNFWSANCHYIATRLKPVNTNVPWDHLYIAGEFWIGTGIDRKQPQADGLRAVSLHENPSGIGLYKHAVEPQEYSDYHLRWKNHLIKSGPVKSY